MVKGSRRGGGVPEHAGARNLLLPRPRERYTAAISQEKIRGRVGRADAGNVLI